MKIVLGVDQLSGSKDVIDLLQNLNFRDCHIEALRVIESLAEAPNYPIQQHARTDLISQYVKMVNDEATDILTAVQEDLKGRNFASVKTHVRSGFISNKLMEHANQISAEIIALGSSGKGPIEGILIGSVARKTVNSFPRSVLVAKQPSTHSRPLKVVLATDHSPYMNRCVDEFMRWAPQGIGELIVTTVFPEQVVKTMTAVVENFKADAAGWVRTELERLNLALIGRLSSMATKCTSRVEAGTVSETIERVMKDEKADLLVLGAQGHGFVERMTLGSVSLDQVIRKPYSVFVIRV